MVNSKIVAEIEKCYNECLKRAKFIDSDYWNTKAEAYRNVLAILDDTLEAKEVDLEKEIDEVIYNYKLNNHRHTSICAPDIEWIANHSSDDHHYRIHCMERFTEWYDNAIDACYKMILKLHELKKL